MTGKTHKRYAVRQKLQVLEEFRQLCREQNLSLCGAAAELGIPHSLLIKWNSNIPTLVAAQKKDLPASLI